MKTISDQIRIIGAGVAMLLVLMLVAMLMGCGGSGGGGASGGAAPHVPDNTPHEYIATFYALTNTDQPHPATLHQICNFGLPSLRDNRVDFIFQDPNTVGGVGCGGSPGPGQPYEAVNYSLEAINTGTDVLYLDFKIDGVSQYPGGLIVQPGTSFTYQAGF